MEISQLLSPATAELLLLGLPQSPDGRSDGGGGCGGVHPGTTGHGSLAPFAVPDADHLSLHRVLEEKRRGGSEWSQERLFKGPHLSAERAGVFGVLRDFDLLDHLTQGGSISGAVLSNDSDLLCTLGLRREGGGGESGISPGQRT